MTDLPLSRREMGARLIAAIEAEAWSARSAFVVGQPGSSSESAIRDRHERELSRLRAAGAPAAALDAARERHARELREAPEVAAEHARRQGKTVAVKGRITREGTKVWDVFELNGTSKPRLVHSGIRDAGEAVAIGGDLVLGRVRVSFAGVRSCFENAGRLLAPARTIDRAGEHRVRMAKAGDDSLVISTKG